MPVTFDLTAAPPSPSDLDVLAALLLGGGVALLPTDTIYGLHAPANDAGAVGRIFALKGRDDGKPLLVLGDSLAQLRTAGVEPDARAAALLESIWPAPLTAILPLATPIAASRGASTIAVRVPDVGWLRDLLRRTGPLASTSANRSGEPSIATPVDLPAALRDLLDAVVDAGPLAGSASTIVDFTPGVDFTPSVDFTPGTNPAGSEPRVVRQGDFLFTHDLWKSLWISL